MPAHSQRFLHGNTSANRERDAANREYRQQASGPITGFAMPCCGTTRHVHDARAVNWCRVTCPRQACAQVWWVKVRAIDGQVVCRKVKPMEGR